MGLRKKSNKNPPILSHEFVIQNHADILSCILMVFIVALYFQVSASFGSLFITLNHNITVNKTIGTHQYEDYNSLFTNGPKDLCFIFFYFLTLIIYHAVIQEYVLDKTNRKLHLSKVKTNKFNESGGLLAYYIPFFILALYIILNGYIPQINSLWIDYPTTILPWNVKIFFLLQIATWLHFYPEIYFQKIPQEDWSERCTYISLYVVFIAATYFLSFTKVALVLLTIQYFEQIIFHLSRIIHFSGKNEISKYGFMSWNIVFIACRLISFITLVLTFYFGLSKTSIPQINLVQQNFNTPIIRYNCMVAFGLLQAWLMWNFVNFHMRKRREKIGGDKKMLNFFSFKSSSTKNKNTEETKKKKRDSNRSKNPVSPISNHDNENNHQNHNSKKKL
ncbi:unnamed protein product [Gordionus sp. m RMFG-2023]|uniref:translocating chain-associated membrane protein 1-like 1 n=1 Tax=Gordionus sp. m RMFG-2023 TaxID=3053472 RepID=UPI0030E12C6A